jgi:hypothetical protein
VLPVARVSNDSSRAVALQPRAAEASPDVIAKVLVEGFDHHYALFRECARAAKRYFEAGNWLAIGHVAGDRIDFYDRRVAETVGRIERDFRFGDAGSGNDAFWAQVKQRFIALLVDHRQPECAETFFNTVSSKLLHRTYFHNRCLFGRRAVSTEYLDDGAPSYRCYYPRRHGLRAALIDLVLDLKLASQFDDFRTDLIHVLSAMRRRLPRPFVVDANFQIQVLSTCCSQSDRVRRGPRRPVPDLSVRRGDQTVATSTTMSTRCLTDLRLALLFGEPRVSSTSIAVRVRRLPAHDGARPHGLRALRSSTSRSTARLYSAFLHHLNARPTVRRRARHQGP